MTRVDIGSRLKILITISSNEESNALRTELECLGHRVEVSNELSDALRFITVWHPDLLITEEGFGHKQPDAGLRLVECCRTTEDQVNGYPGTRSVMLVPVPDWNRVKRAQASGAHVILKVSDFSKAIRYVQTVADDIGTDRILGPCIVGIHKYKGPAPRPDCSTCEWVGAEITYASSKTDVPNLTAVRICLLNALLFRHRGQRPIDIENASRESPFLKALLGKHVFRCSAVKMETTRLRKHFDQALEILGLPYRGKHFLPVVLHGAEFYRLSGNRQLIHTPDDPEQLRPSSQR